jgi:Mce-associated membrane protein
MILRGRRRPELDTDGLAEAAEAEAAEAEAAGAEARAAVARARAIRLRQEAESAQPVSGDDTSDVTSVDVDVEATTGTAISARRARPHRSSSKALSVGAAIVVLGACGAASGYMVWHHHLVAQKGLVAADFVAAARKDVAALMSLDFNKTQEDMQRIADNSTGAFKQHFPVIAQQLTQGLQRSKVVTTVTVGDVAVESMTDNSAVVLIAATTQAKEADGPPEPRSWHIALTLLRDGGQPKMSNVEFVQ